MKCAECGKKLKWPYFGVWTAKNGTKGWYCSSSCCIQHSGLPGVQNNGINSCVTALFMLPFVLAATCIKGVFKTIFSKCGLTLLSFGMAPLAYKLLGKVYGPKK